MKLIPLGRVNDFDARTFLIQMLESAPNGQTIGEMRKRLAVLDKLNAAAPDATAIVVDDADRDTLLGVINARGDFAVTRREIIQIVDGVANAAAPPAAVKEPTLP